MRKYLGLVLIAAAAIAAVVVLSCPMPPQWTTPRFARLGDFGHFFLFGGMTLGFWWLLGRRLVLAVSLATALNALCEVGQLFSNRHADVFDFLRGLLGSLVVALLIRMAAGPKTPARIGGHLLASLALTVWPLMEAAPYAADVADELRRFPVLCDFQSPWQTTRWSCADAEVRYMTCSEEGGVPAGRIILYCPHSVAVLYPLVRDWSDCKYLCLECSSEDPPAEVTVALASSSADGIVLRTIPGHFGPEFRRWTIDLEAAATDGEGPALDLGSVICLGLAVEDKNMRPRELRLRKIWLQ